MIEQTTGIAAKFCSRTAAFLIDILALAMMVGIFGLIMVSISLMSPTGNIQHQVSLLSLTWCWIMFTPVFLVPAYFMVFHTIGGVTPGKLIMGIRVVGRENGPLRPGISFLRVTGYLLSGLPMAAGFFWVLLDRDREAWHDKLAGTRVIYT